jgi:hypothetical protein
LFTGTPYSDDAVDAFESIVLRANNSEGIARATQREWKPTLIRDQWAKDAARAMGMVAPHSRSVHVYINGLYWGVYDLTERIDEHFAESYFGGDSANYDVINADESVDPGPSPRAGDMVAWNEMIALAAGGLSSNAAYQQIQQYLDVDQFIDYMLLEFYSGNWDWPQHNWQAVRERSPEGRFTFVAWDLDVGLGVLSGGSGRTVSQDRTGVANANSPGALYDALRQNADFRLLFADHIHKHFFNDGALTPENAAAIFQYRVDEIYNPVVAETARWGDYGSGTTITRENTWLPEVNWLLDEFFPQRTQIVLDQLIARGLYPAVGAPSYQVAGVPKHGGLVSAGAMLSMLSGDADFVDTTLVDEASTLTAFVPNGAEFNGDLSWTAIGFNPSAPGTPWGNRGVSGTGTVGYDNGDGDYGPLGIDFESQMYLTNASVFVRQTFLFDNSTAFDRLQLQIRYDDGFVAYLNGTEIARSTNVDVIDPPASAKASISHESGEAFEIIDVTAWEGLLVNGLNVFAIHGLNSDLDSSDMLIAARLVGGEDASGGPAQLPVYYTLDGSDPRDVAGTPVGTLYAGAFPLLQSATVKARTLDAGVWSALSEAQFTVETPLRITEIMYHPSNPTEAELGAGFTSDGDFEYIELQNIGGSTIDLTGVRFIRGISFDFTGSAVTSLAPGEFVVIVKNAAAFAARYNTIGVNIAGQFAGGTSLDNGGETLTLVDAGGGAILDFRYGDDDWYASPDGDGYSLVIVDAEGDRSQWAEQIGWRPSHALGGSPGWEDHLPGDFNGDNRVNLVDLAILQRNFGSTAATRITGDLTEDANVSRRDLGRLAQNYGHSYSPPVNSPSALSAASPEPENLAAPTEARVSIATSARRRSAGVRRPIREVAEHSAIAAAVNPVEALQAERRQRRVARPHWQVIDAALESLDE